MNRNELRKRLKSALAEVPEIMKSTHDDTTRGTWELKVATALEEFFGKDSDELKSLNRCKKPQKRSTPNGLKKLFNQELECRASLLREIVKRKK